jgi:membrane-associated phospholipid phosphatase
VGGAEYAGIATFGVGAALVESEYGRPQAKWKGHNGFDDSIRDALRLKSRRDRETAQNIGDLLMWGMIAAPVLDSFATLGVRDGAWDAQWQTQMVNLESFAFTSLVSAGVQTLVAREKPSVRNCQNGVCEGDNKNRSMPSGHAAFAFTGAGLVCNHHRYQSLYHDPAADRAACATGIVLATADGVVRIMADHHYATDVLAGSAIGLFSGFFLPRLLHYSHPEPFPSKKGSHFPLLRQLSLRPLVGSGSTGLTCELRF